MAAGCAVDATGTQLVLFSFCKNLNNFQSSLQHSVVITLWITRDPPRGAGLVWTRLLSKLSFLWGEFFVSSVTSSIKHPDILPANARTVLKSAWSQHTGLKYEQYIFSSGISGTLPLDSFLLDASVPVWIRPDTWAPVSQWSNDPDTPTIAALEEGIHSRLCFSMSYF